LAGTRPPRSCDSYRASLKELENPQVRAFLGWCYTQVGDNRAALENYRLAYKAQPRHDIALGLASLEFMVGDKNTALTVLKGVQDARGVLSPNMLAELERLETKFGLSSSA
jgi:hypothetical protein